MYIRMYACMHVCMYVYVCESSEFLDSPIQILYWYKAYHIVTWQEFNLAFIKLTTFLAEIIHERISLSCM